MSASLPTMTRRLLRLPAEIVVGFYLVLDALVGPLFRPLVRGLSRLDLVQRMRAAIAVMPPYGVFVLLVVPFAVAELAKAYAVFLIGSGHLTMGVTLFVAAYVVSILVCERIFSAGKAQLMTIGWFARLFRWMTGYKGRILTWFRSTDMGRIATGLRQRLRLAWEKSERGAPTSPASGASC